MKVFSYILNIVLLVAVIWLLLGTERIAEAPDTSSDTEAQPETVIAFQPSGKFTEAEQQEIREKILSPYVAYANCMGESQPVSVLVTETSTTGYRYAVDMLFAPEEGDVAGYYGFLHGPAQGALDYWVPDLLLTKCVDVLPNADEVRDRAIDEYRG